MKAGFAVPNIGRVATVGTIVKVAQRAEALGYNSLWTIDRLLWPIKPQTPYGLTPDGSLPEPYKYILDPLDVLTFAAAHTSTVKLGTSVLDMPYYNPVTLARRLTSIDVLSNGRLCVGLGLGWSKDEMVASGAPPKRHGVLAEEFIQVLKAVWTASPVAFQGEFYQIPSSYLERKPVQQPHPPIYLAAFAPASMRRVATMTDGWNPVAIPVQGMAQMFQAIQEMAQTAGREPSSLKMIVRANIDIRDTPLPNERLIFSGTIDQIKEDIAGCKQIGAHEIFFDPTFCPGAQSEERWLDLMDQFRALV